MVAVVPVLVVFPLALLIGLFAGFQRSRAGEVVMRILDVLFAFPLVLLAIALAAVLGAGLGNVMLAIGITLIPYMARVAYTATVTESSKDYLEAARAYGANPVLLMFRELMPNVIVQLLVYATTLCGLMIVVASGLSFLGVSVIPPTPDWGIMTADGKNVVAGRHLPRRHHSRSDDPGGVTGLQPDRRRDARRTRPTKADQLMAENALDIKNLSVDFHTDGGVVHAVKNADICVREGGILGLVGESGSGKSVTSLAVLRLLGTDRARITNGEILFRGEDLLDKSEAEMRAVRGSHIGMVSQNALSAARPVVHDRVTADRGDPVAPARGQGDRPRKGAGGTRVGGAAGSEAPDEGLSA